MSVRWQVTAVGRSVTRRRALWSGFWWRAQTAGHFDRMVTLAAVRTVWDGLPRPWLFAGESARMHFTQRAAGQRSIASGGDLFRGRREALAAVRGWFCADAGPGVPLVITAQPGAGKSAVLARAVLEIEQHRAMRWGSVPCPRCCGGRPCRCRVGRLRSGHAFLLAGARGGADGAGHSDDVLVVAVDALDEAKSDQDLAELRQALRELGPAGLASHRGSYTSARDQRRCTRPGLTFTGLACFGEQTAATWSI